VILPCVEAGDADTVRDVVGAGQRARVQRAHEERLEEAVGAVLAQAALLRVAGTQRHEQNGQPQETPVPGALHFWCWWQIRNTSAVQFVVVALSLALTARSTTI